MPGVLLAGIIITGATFSARSQSGSPQLDVTYTNGYIGQVDDSGERFRIDIEGFTQTYDGQPDGRRLLTVGHPGRKVVVTIDYDTLYEDVPADPAEYEDLWWYFYSQGEDLDITRHSEWDTEGRHWSTHTNQTAHGIDVNERHYDMFQLTDTHWFHVSIKRPFYLEGDSTFMISVLESFEVLPADSAE